MRVSDQVRVYVEGGNAVRICMCGSFRFRLEQICAVTDLVSE